MLTPKDVLVRDRRIAFCERNISRWNGAWGIRSRTVDGKVERILVRKNELGVVTARLRISAFGFENEMHLLSFEHKKMWNLIERLFDRQGSPADCWIEISSIAFYDFLFDIACMDDPTRRKFRDTKKYADMVYRLLMVLTGTAWMFEDWETKTPNGTGLGVKRLNLIDEFQMFGRTTSGVHGKIRIKINPDVAEGLRQRHTTPILIEVQNAINSPTAGILYGYLSQYLFKRPKFEMEVSKLADLLQIGTERHVVRDFRHAAKELDGLDFASGRIAECRIEKRGRDHFFCAKRAPRPRLLSAIPRSELDRRAHERRILDAQIERDEYIKRFYALPDDERTHLQKEVDEKLAGLGIQLNFGRKIHEENAIVDVMERSITKKNDQLIGRICAPVLRERNHVPYLSNGERAIYRSLVEVLRWVADRKSDIVAVI